MDVHIEALFAFFPQKAGPGPLDRIPDGPGLMFSLFAFSFRRCLFCAFGSGGCLGFYLLVPIFFELG